MKWYKQIKWKKMCSLMSLSPCSQTVRVLQSLNKTREKRFLCKGHLTPKYVFEVLGSLSRSSGGHFLNLLLNALQGTTFLKWNDGLLVGANLIDQYSSFVNWKDDDVCVFLELQRKGSYNLIFIWTWRVLSIRPNPAFKIFSIPDFDVPFPVTGTGMTNSIPNFRERER